jgi:hypothetical protein
MPSNIRDIEALIHDYDGNASGSGEPFEASRRDFVRLLVRTAERMGVGQVVDRGGPHLEGALWNVLNNMVSAMNILRYDPLSDRLEANPKYELDFLTHWA